MAEFDMDAARAARAEAAGGTENHQFIFGGITFTVPFELPWDASKLFADPDAFALALLGEEQFEDFTALHPSTDDMEVFGTGISRLYGFGSPGESPASSASSKSNGKRSKPTSKGTTKSASATPSGAPAGAG